MTHKSVIQRLDDAANWTGVPKLAGLVEKRRRSMRWLPIVPLLLAFAGVTLCFARESGFPPGYIAVVFGFSLSVWMPMFGPLKPWGAAAENADERERELRRRAFLVTLWVVAMFGVVSLMMVPAVAEILGWTMDRLTRAMMALGMALFTVFNALPTLYASWATRPLPDEED